MALVVNTNVPSIASQRYLMESRREMETAMERLSSGKRINNASDDAAGLAISTRMDSQIRGLNVAIRNANDGMSLIQTAEGAMTEVTNMLQRMRELSLQAVHGVNNDDDRAALDAEVQALKAEIDRIAESTTFNNQAILDGSYNGLFQIGKDANDTLGVSIAGMDTNSLGLIGSSQASSSGTSNVLISSRLAVQKFDADSDGAYSSTATTTFNGNDAAGVSFAAGDIKINGQELAAFDGTSTTGHDIFDLVTNINENVDNVSASAFNTVVAKVAGDGIVRAEQVSIRVGAIGQSTDDHYQPAREVVLGSSDSLEEMVANINAAFYDGEVEASINSDGKLVLSNNTGATIQVADETGTTGGYDGATGFKVNATTTNVTATGALTYDTAFQGFLKLESTDDTPIEVTKGNTALASPGTSSDVQNIGFMEVSEDPTGTFYTVTGSQGFTNSSSTVFSRNTTTGQADLTINGVEIYDDTMSPLSSTFQGKLDLINSFSDETGVVASAYFERVIDTSSVSFVGSDTFSLNGVSITMGTTLAATVTAINGTSGANTAQHGITASAEGSNLILRGDGVQNVNITTDTYSLASVTQSAARRTGDSTTLAQTVTFGGSSGAGDLAVGRVLTLTIAGTTNGDANTKLNLAATTTASTTFSYTVKSGDGADDVASAFRDLILNDIADNISTTAAMTPGALVSVSSGSLTFKTALGAGSHDITVGLTQTPNANRIIGAASANYTGALRLQATDQSPISIEFNTDGELAGLKEMNVGDTTFDVNTPTVDVSTSPTSTVSGLSVGTSSAANDALGVIDAALASVSAARSNLGAVENRLDHTISNLSNVVENTAAAQSRIVDADFAAEAANLARAQILQQAGTAMLAQANAAPQNVLSLLG